MPKSFRKNSKIKENKRIDTKPLKKELHFNNEVEIKFIENKKFNNFDYKKEIFLNNRISNENLIEKLSDGFYPKSIFKSKNRNTKINLKYFSNLDNEKKNFMNNIKQNEKNDKQFQIESENYLSSRNIKLDKHFKNEPNLSFNYILNMKATVIPKNIVLTPNYNFKFSQNENALYHLNHNIDSKNQFFLNDKERIFQNDFKHLDNFNYGYINSFENAYNKNDYNDKYNKFLNENKKNIDRKERSKNFKKFKSSKLLSFYSALDKESFIDQEKAMKINKLESDSRNKIFISSSFLNPLGSNFRKYVAIDDELLLLAFQKISENAEKNKILHLKSKKGKYRINIFSYFNNQKLNTLAFLISLCLSSLVEPCFCIIISTSLAILSGDEMTKLKLEGNFISWIYFVISFLPFIINFFLQFFSLKIKEDYLKNLKNALYDKMQKIHICFYDIQDNYPPSILINKILYDLTNISAIFFSNLEDIIRSCVLFFVGITIAFTYEWRMTLIASIFIPLLLFSLIFQFKFKTDLIKNINKLDQDANNIFIKAINNTKLIMSYGIQKNIYRRYKHFLKDGIKYLNRKNLITGVVYGLEELINYLNYGFSFYFGGYFILKDSLNFGDMIKTVFAIVTFLIGLAALHKGLSEFPFAKLSIDRLLSILNTEDYLNENEEEKCFNLNMLKKNLEKNNVDRYIYDNSKNVNHKYFKYKNDDFEMNKIRTDQEENKENIIKNKEILEIGKKIYVDKTKASSNDYDFLNDISINEKIHKEIKGKIEFKNVYFSFPERPEEIILKGVNFVITPGQKVAIIGSLDSGKNLIIDLIERFYDVCHGEILIDDIDIKNYDLICLRKQIGLVMYNSFYMKNESISNNLKYGNLNVSNKDFEFCLKKLDLYKLIKMENDLFQTNEIKNGLKEEINNNSLKFESDSTFLTNINDLKISIGRILLKKPKITIFENSLSFSHINNEIIIDNLSNKIREETTFINIMEKPFLMKKYDLIFLFEDGIIIEKGKHRNLMNKQGIYFKLYNQYLS